MTECSATGLPPNLTIIIPTVCSEARGHLLMRAIASARASSQRPPHLLVVANGPLVSERIYAQLQKMPEVRTLRLRLGSAPHAVLEGRKLVGTNYFGFLDDDDELLPGSSDSRLEVLQQNMGTDAVVMNGYREIAGQRQLMHPHLRGIEEQPLRALLDFNWLASCAALFRTATVGADMFESPQKYAEWTWLAYRLALAERRFKSIDNPGYVIHDTPASLSKSSSYFEAYVELFDRMLSERPPAWAKRRIIQKRCATLHDLSEQALRLGNWRQALILHMRSIASPSGLKYFLYGRKIVSAAAGSIGSRGNVA
jgi:hypothetical protein